jgi:hypothetical protein
MKTYLFNIKTGYMTLVNAKSKHLTTETVDGVTTNLNEIRSSDLTYDSKIETLQIVDDVVTVVARPNYLENLKTHKLNEIKEARNAEYTSILITSDGLHFHSDLETIIDVKTMIEMLALDTDTFADYKNADGTYNTITKLQFQTALIEGSIRKVTAFGKQKVLVEAVEAATAKAELDAIVW